MKNILCLCVLLGFVQLEGKLMEGFPPAVQNQVTPENWMQAPYNRWGFQNVRRISPTAKILKGATPPTQFEQGKKDLLSLYIDIPIFRDMTIKEMLEYTNTDGYLVLHHGKIVAEEYLNSMNKDTLHITWSISKSILGLIAGVLVENGELDPSKLVTHYIPELKGSGYSDATIQNLLEMTVALDSASNDEFSSFKSGDKWDSYSSLKNMKKDGEHGESFYYTSPTALVLGWVTERVTNTYLPDLISKMIWSHLGTENGANSIVDHLGVAQPSGGISTTLRDLGRFGQMILQNGYYNEQQIIPKKWVETTRKGGSQEVFANSLFGHVMSGGSYHDMWWIDGDGSLMALGAYGQILYINFDADVVIVQLTSQPSMAEIQQNLMSHLAINTVIEHLSQ